MSLEDGCILLSFTFISYILLYFPI